MTRYRPDEVTVVKGLNDQITAYIVNTPDEIPFDDLITPETVDRFEVIDELGRKYIRKDCQVIVSIQDDGRTVRAFVTKRRNEHD